MPFPDGGDASTSSPRIASPDGAAHPLCSEDLARPSRLILPNWDIPVDKHLHPSLDLISLLHLDTLCNTFVRPYADAEDDDAAAAANDRIVQGTDKGKVKKRRMEKGYNGLIDDCIDPTPLGGERNDHQSLVPLIADLLGSHGPSPQLWTDPLELLPLEAFQVARLDSGMKQDGYGGGQKVGVREAEEKRRRKKSRHSQTVAAEVPSPLLPSPAVDTFTEILAPVAPPTRGYPINQARQPSFAANVRPFATGRGGGGGVIGGEGGAGAGAGARGSRANQSMLPRPPIGTGNGLPNKRPLEGAGGGQPKRAKVGSHSRSTSPGGQGRPNGPTWRSRTEGR